MHPLVRGAAAAAILTALGSLDRDAPEPPPATSAAPSAGITGARDVSALPSPCGPGTLPEGPVCVRIPGETEALPGKVEDPRGADPARGELGADRIPRRPERPIDPAAYLYPVGAPAGEGAAPRVMGGTEGGRPGVRVAARPGEKVLALGLLHQVGPAEVVFVGDLAGGRTVVTAHTVDEGGRQRTYLLVHGSLDRASPEAVQGAKLAAGAVVGFARTENAGRLIEVYVEARELREGRGLDAAAARPADPAVSVPTDVRNVLPLR
jgi:hypothetical protein